MPIDEREVRAAETWIENWYDTPAEREAARREFRAAGLLPPLPRRTRRAARVIAFERQERQVQEQQA